jgi:hypothetical protein
MTVKTDRPKLNWYKSAVLGPYKAGRNSWYQKGTVQLTKKW